MYLYKFGYSLLGLLGLFVLFALVGNDAYAETGKKPDPAMAKRGAKLYTQNCLTCHGKRGVGEPMISPFIRRPGYISAPALNDSQHAWHHTDNDLVKFILKGSSRTKRMPSFAKTLTTHQVRDLVAYIKSLWGSRALTCQGPRHMSCMR